ncbi:MAG: hypothetical protein H7X80_04005, partial [bacterium]|nr:hypothetical protein [Candidatus Kapabacteria bacterium]
MVQRFRLARRAFALAFMAALVTGAASTATAQYSCFPTCSNNDGRFLSLASAGLDAFCDNAITIGIGLPGTATALNLGIFDGETFGVWDKGNLPLVYELYADPNGDGTDATLIATYDFSSGFANDDWSTLTVPVSTAALAPSGNYVYYLKVSMGAPVAGTTAAATVSSFKIRVAGGSITVRSHQSISIHAPLYTNLDGARLYPQWGNYSGLNPLRFEGSSYSGDWSIYLDVPTPSKELTIWDGDMDHGSNNTFVRSATDARDPNEFLEDSTAADGSVVQVVRGTRSADTDDEDTPATPPTWAVGTNPEIAVSNPNPYDDNASAMYRRSPAVNYEIVFPDGATAYRNSNPSSSMEWEQYRISIETMDRA